jgi:hypothetical protein
MKQASLILAILATTAISASTGYAADSVRTAPRGARGFYGTNFGNRYQYFGLGYGYSPGAFGPGGWSGYSGRMGGLSGGGLNAGGLFGGPGRYGNSGRYGGYSADLQQQALHQQQMMWSMNFAPIPQMPPAMTINPYWNPYQSRLGDNVYHRDQPPPMPETIENPFVHSHPRNNDPPPSGE